MAYRRLYAFASAAVIIAGIGGVLAPPLAAAPARVTAHGRKSSPDPVIGYIYRWVYIDDTCYGGDAPPANPDLMAMYLVHGTIIDDEGNPYDYTDTGEDYVGTGEYFDQGGCGCYYCWVDGTWQDSPLFVACNENPDCVGLEDDVLPATP